MSHFLETLVMKALKRERPSAGFNGLCRVKSVLLQEKKIWGMEQERAMLLPIAI